MLIRRFSQNKTLFFSQEIRTFAPSKFYQLQYDYLRVV